MKATIRTTFILMLTLMLSVTGIPVFAGETAADPAAAGSTAASTEQIDDSASEEEPAGDTEQVNDPDPEEDSTGETYSEDEEADDLPEPEEPAFDTEQLRSAPAARSSEMVSGSFEKINGKDVATIRYYVDEARTEYRFAKVDETSSGYEYSFDAPYDGFTPVPAASDDAAADSANIIAEYYSTTKWDGAVDVSWYNETSGSFEISEPAQLAGLAAVVNGSINNTTPIYRVKGTRSDLSKTFDYDTPQTSKHQDMNEGLPDCIRNKYYEKTNLIAGVEDEAYEGLPEHDFADRTVYITADLDMGGTDPSNIDHSANESRNAYDGVYPNWTPIGGEYLMDPSDGATMIKAAFNGSIDGGGHSINNLYCFRWSYRSVGDTAYGYAQGTGLIGMMGSLYDGESQPSVIPSVKNMSLGGYIYGRRMVGGFVGCMGGGANAASGKSLECGVNLENLANHAEVHCTDSKGLGGIVACSMLDKGNVINCYNTGYMDANYAAPSGGIIGSNEGMNVFCCYNTGTIYTHGNKRGRGIGCNNSGKNYRVDNCYYLEGCGDDDVYPGYYTYNLAKSVSVNTEALSEKDMKNGTLLQKLNVNGTAYAEGDDGYPVLYWEKNPSPGKGNLKVENNEAEGTVAASQTDTMDNGTVVYLTGTPQTGFKCIYFINNGEKLSGNYVTVNGNCTVGGYFEEVKPGTIKIKGSDVCSVTITKKGTIYTNGIAEDVDDYPVNNGDPVYEKDRLMLQTTFKSGSVPEDEDLIYRASAPDFFANPYEFTYSYEDENGETKASETTALETYEVGSDITGDEITLVLSIKPLTSQKMWDYSADTSWYSDSKQSFTINNAHQLAGLSVLVDQGKTFSGKSVALGRDISLKNDDGTSGSRFWNGIGSAQSTSRGFAGTFDGNGHKITDYLGNANGLFEYCEGESKENRAVIKNLELWGSSTGQNACGFVMKAKNTDITGCVSYCTVGGTISNGNTASILGYANGSCHISSCVNYAEISGKGYVGGIVGDMDVSSSAENCINKGNIFCLDTSGNSVGGLVGSLNGRILKSANYGNIRTYGKNTGGIAGQSVSSDALIDSCSNTGRITYLKGTNQYDAIGGIIGYASRFNVKDSFNYGVVEKLSGTMPEEHIGGVFGRRIIKKDSKCKNVYYLDTACEYAEAGTAPEDLDPEAEYTKEIHVATVADFALPDRVLANINNSDDPAFVLTNGIYPELLHVSGTHVHSGGEATCSTLAVCEECGLSYGLYSDKHGGTRVVGAREAVWLTDGYSGDICCRECGEVITKGRAIKADPDRQAVSFVIRSSDNNADIHTYTVGQFDALKTSEPAIGYSYGSKSSEITAATQYVTLDSVLQDLGINRDDISSIVVECTGSRSVVDAETLAECNKYYEGDNVLDAPAAFMIAWNTGSGTLEEVAGDSSIGGTIRFGYGISEAQQTLPVGGARLVSPVETVTINIGDAPEAVSISNASVTVSPQTYTGNPVEPSPKVMFDGTELREGTDYRLLYTNNTNVGQAKVIIIGIGGYTGSRSEFFRINGLSIESAEITIDAAGLVYSGTPHTPKVNATINGAALTEGIEYSVSYSDNTDAGTAAVIVTGIGNYEGTATDTFVIGQRSLSKATVLAQDTIYSGAAARPAVTVTIAGKVLTPGTDFDVSYANNVSAGTAKVTIAGKGNYKDTASGGFTIARKNISGADVAGVANKTFTGKAQTLNPSVILGGSPLVLSRDYKVSYSNSTNVGTASVNITGTGNYTGSIAKSFRIVPIKAAVSKITVKKGKKIMVKMKTPATKTGGANYAVQYRIKGKSAWTTKYTAKQSITLTKLKAGKKYQIRVRACKGSLFGAWSAVKTTGKIRK